MSAAIRLHYLRSLFDQTIHVLDSMPSGAAAATITATSNTLQIGISEKLSVFIEYTATIIAAIAIAFTYSWSLTLVTSSAMLSIVLVFSIVMPFIMKGHARINKAETKAAAVATEAFSAIRMITSCGAEGQMVKKYTEWVQKARQAGQSMNPFMSIQSGFASFGMQGAFALTFWYGTQSYNKGRINSVGTVFIVLMSVMLVVYVIVPQESILCFLWY